MSNFRGNKKEYGAQHLKPIVDLRGMIQGACP